VSIYVTLRKLHKKIKEVVQALGIERPQRHVDHHFHPLFISACMEQTQTKERFGWRQVENLAQNEAMTVIADF
jgi:hypothetical protein